MPAFHYHIIALVFLLFLPFGFLKADSLQDRAPDPSRVDAWIEEGRRLYARAPERARILWDSAVAYARERQLWAKQLEALTARMFDPAFQARFGQWKQLLLQADSVLLVHGQALAGEKDALQISIRQQWGMYYYGLGWYRKALENLEAASTFLQKKPLNDEVCQSLYSIQQFISSTYGKLGAYDSAIQVGLNSLRYYDCYRDKHIPPDYRQAYFRVANFFLAKGEVETAGDYFRKGLQSLYIQLARDSSNYRMAVLSFSDLAQYFLQCHQPDSAAHVLDQALRYQRAEDPFGVPVFTLLGDTYRQKGNPALALTHYQKARSRYRRLLGDKDHRLGAVNRTIGDVYRQLGKPDEALVYYQESLANLVLDFQGKAGGSLANPRLEAVLGKVELMKTLHAKAEVLLEKSRKNPAKYLDQALETNALALELIEQIKYDLLQDEERQLQMANAYPIYETALEIEYLKYRNGRANEAFESALNLCDGSKSLSLLTVIRQLSSLYGSGERILEQERQLKAELARLEQQIFARLSYPADTAGLARLTERRRQLQYDYVTWTREVQREHPDFFQLKLDREQMTLPTIRRELLEPGQAMVEYFWGERALFTLLVTREETRLWRQDIASIKDSLDLFYRLIENPSSREELYAQKRLQDLSFYLYRALMEDPLTLLQGAAERLLIIRDGRLGHLPFELLVTANDGRALFSKDRFLGGRFIVSYANSAALLLRQRTLASQPPNHFLAGFAPSYEQNALSPADTFSNAPLAYLVRSGLFPLEGARRELQAIRRVTGGRLFRKGRATEENFKKYAGAYQVLHLAMHALTNNEQPQFSELVFSLTPEESEDGRLKAIELYNMRLHSQMAVLSACSTGYGEWRRGEGVVCLGHAFTYAGVPSIIMSQWNIPDQATAEIMTAFYTYLKEHKTKDEALALAKRHFLENHPEMTHPFFWAGFIAFGDMAPLDIPPSSFPWLQWTGIGLLVFLLAFTVRRRRRSGSNPTV